VPDPQKVPEAVLERVKAVKPEELMGADFWKAMVRARNLGLSRARGWKALSSALEPYAVSR